MTLEMPTLSKLSPVDNMKWDESLLQSLEHHPRPILHFYNWEQPAVTYGYFMDPSLHLKSGTDLKSGRRPTGGGMIFHHCDLAFAVLIPAAHPGYSVNTLSNYAFINEAVRKAIEKFKVNTPAFFQKECIKEGCSDFCMAKPTIYDVIIEGKKVGGGAQRRTKHGLLHQGTVALALPSKEFLTTHLLQGELLYEQMQNNSLSLLPEKYTPQDFEEASTHLKRHLIQELRLRL
jgi:lipoate-protein ligase A